MFFLDGIGKGIQLGKGFFTWQAFTQHGAKDFNLQIGNKAGNLFHNLGAPAIRANNGGMLEFGP